MKHKFYRIVSQHQAEARIVHIAFFNVLERKIELLNDRG